MADPGFSPGGGANSQKCYYFSIFARKLHKNERIWTPRGGRASLAPPLDPPMEYRLKFEMSNYRPQRSCGKVRFLILFTGGISVPACTTGHMTTGFLSRGVSVWVVSVQVSWCSLSRGVSV